MNSSEMIRADTMKLTMYEILEIIDEIEESTIIEHIQNVDELKKLLKREIKKILIIN